MILLNINKSNIKFHDELSKMPISKLETEIFEDIIGNYEIVILDIEKVLSHIHQGKIYNEFVIDNKMRNLIKFIKEDNYLIPPVIRIIDRKIWTILDGQHRLGLFVYLGFTSVPFLIRKDQVKYLNTIL